MEVGEIDKINEALCSELYSIQAEGLSLEKAMHGQKKTAEGLSVRKHVLKKEIKEAEKQNQLEQIELADNIQELK